MEREPEAIWQETTLVWALRQMADDLAAVSDIDDLADVAVRWASAMAGSDHVAVRLALPNPAGRLVVARSLGWWPSPGRAHTARRREAFRTGVSSSVPVREPAGWGLRLVPIVSGGTSLGVLEIAAPERSLAEAWDALDVLASHVALSLSTTTRRAHLRREVDALASCMDLSLELMRATSPASAIRAAVGFLAKLDAGPAAAWLGEGDPPQLRLVALSGVGTRKRREIHAAFGTLAPWSSLADPERRRTFARIGHLLGLSDVAAFGSDETLLLTGKSEPLDLVSLDLVGSLVVEALRKLAVVASAERQREQLDEGIAWTAHELRGPLLGVRAVLESLQREDGGSPAGLALLRRSERELGQLAALTDGLLRWAVGAEPLRRRERDVVAVVEEAVDSCRLEAGEDRVTIDAPARATSRIDPTSLRVAVANVVRNALAYSPRASQVHVSVRSLAGSVRIQVRDGGAGVAPEELGRIFDPFVRGEAGRRSSLGGSGLGLFIARRIAEAHDGSIIVEASDPGATFTIQLPTCPDGRSGAEVSTS